MPLDHRSKSDTLWDTVTPKAVLIDNLVMSGLMKSSFDMIWDKLELKKKDIIFVLV